MSSTQAGQHIHQDNPPAYDTLSIAPPTAHDNSDNTNSNGINDDSGQEHPKKKSLKTRWHEMKAEDKERKAQQWQYVKPEEADWITGLDKHKAEEEERINKGEAKGGKSLLSTMLLL